MKKILAVLLSLALSLSLTAPSFALTVEQARDLLQECYVDPLPQEALNAESLDALLDALGDPYTYYMSAEEYQEFMDSVNGESLIGIGVSVQQAFENGFLISSVLPNSPALAAGLEAGDRLVAVDGVELTAGTDVRAVISGPEGSDVTVTVLRQADGSRKDYTMTRRQVQTPIVTYDTVDNTGYINCTSFGDSTIDTIEEALRALNDRVDLWIMDLRTNPGGTSGAAVGSAGLFAGPANMVYFRGANGAYDMLFTRPNCPDLTDKPLIILTSAYSASGSELFSAAARDHGFGIAVGQRTYGKGIAQTVLDHSNCPDLFDGDCLKLTTHRFYSPDGATNHIIGILPTLLLSVRNTPAAVQLLSSAKPAKAEGFLKLTLTDFDFYLDLSQAQTESYTAAFTELLEALPPAAVLCQGSGTDTWTEIEPAALAASLRLNYTQRTFSDIAGSPFAREIETLAVYRLLSGYEDGSFHPDQPITRAEFSAMLASALGLPANPSALTFSDTDAGQWYAGAVSALASRGFLRGYEDGAFRPDATITYQEMVTVLSSVAAWCSMEGYDLNQKTVSITEYAACYQYAPWAQTPARNLAVMDALVGGLEPNDLGTRQVAAGMLCNLMEHIHLLWY